jgi:hypothetical protein
VFAAVTFDHDPDKGLGARGTNQHPMAFIFGPFDRCNICAQVNIPDVSMGLWPTLPTVQWQGAVAGDR